jgi:hypothetical protein
MKRFIGVKEINAIDMTRAAYNILRDWQLPADENGDDAGYLVEYIDGGQANHKDFKGYISWSPKDVFERAYKAVDGMTFGLALEALKKGYKVARKGWNGKGMWLVLVPGTPAIHPTPETPYGKAGITECEILPHIDMWTTNAHGRRAMLPGWLASQTDMLSEDWEIVQ